MIICNCNALSERDVEAAISLGAKSWRDVHKRLGSAPQCGQCECEIREALDAVSASGSISVSQTYPETTTGMMLAPAE